MDSETTTDAPAQKVSFGKQIVTTLEVTPSAQSKIGELLAGEENGESMALRVAVRPGGCSGLSYEMYFDEEIAADDIVSEFGTVRVAVDPMSAEKLRGSTLDYQDGLQGAGFHINNPNASRTCGCGSSFS